MPCQFCQSSAHTLKNCDSEIGRNMVEDVKTFIQQNKFNINDQIIYLQCLTKPQLSFISKEMRMTYQGTKNWLIFTIIRKYFWVTTDFNQFRLITQEEMNLIHDAYSDFHYQTTLLQTPVSDSQNLLVNIKNMIEAFYGRRYGVRRHGVPIDDYFELLDEILIDAPHRLSFYEREVREEARARAMRAELVIDRIDLGFISSLSHFAVNLLERYRNNQAHSHNVSHLKKLSFEINVDHSLEQAKDCFICCDEKPHAKLGCSHEYCVDCVFGTAKARTKTFIKCAVCRSEVDTVQVGSESIKTQLKQKIDKV